VSATNRQVGLAVGGEWQERGVINGPVLEVLEVTGRKVRVRWWAGNLWRTGEVERGAFVSKFRRCRAPSAGAKDGGDR
jgi:hypothetical protein